MFLTAPVFYKKIKHLIVFIFFIILTLAITHPLVFNIENFLPYPGDPFLNTWIISWNLNKLINFNFTDYFDSNIFYPNNNTFAYSENLIGQSLMVLPIYLLKHNPVLAHNVWVFLSFIISAFGVYLLVFYYTKNFMAGILAGIIFGFAPFKLIHNYTHLHLSCCWLPYLMLIWELYIKKSKTKFIFLTVLLIFLFISSSLYFSVFLPIIFLIFFLVKYKISRNSAERKKIIKILIITIFFTFFVSLFFLKPYLRLATDGFYRAPEEIIKYTPGFDSYFKSPFNFPVTYNSEMLVGPGYVLLAALTVCLVYLFRQKRELNQETKNNIFIYSVIGLIGLIISLGFFYHWRPWGNGLIAPFYFLYYLVPGFSGIRGVGRFSVFFIFSLAVIVGYVFDSYWRKLKNFNKKIILYFCLSAVVILFFCEVLLINNLYLVPALPIPDVYLWLRAQEDNAIVLELPFTDNDRVQQNYLYVFSSIFHNKRIVNGYSGYEPASYTFLQNKLNNFKPREDYEILKKYQVKYLIIHYDVYSQPEKMRIERLLMANREKYNPVKQFRNDVVYELN